MRNGLRSQAGFSLIETMLVVGIMGVITSIAVIQINSSKQALAGDGAMRVVIAQLNQAKQLAITQRRNMRVTFTGGTSVQVIREEVPGPTLTTISSVPFEGKLQLYRITSPNIGEPPAPELPSPAVTPPYTNGGVAFGAATTEMKFSPEGVFVNQNGIALNGTVFVALPGQTLSARAITLFGSTGRIRAYRWDGSNWKVV
jgi:prepilin-type N-terminal cleavage/methylation domain-containing protein